MLLACFITGQYIVYSHTHEANSGSHKVVVYHNPETSPKTTISENCRLCDAMQHNQMAVSSQVHFAPVAVTAYTYKNVKYHFISIALILSAGRSPPSAS